MDILIIGNDNPELVDKLIEMVSGEDTSVSVIEDFDKLNINMQLAVLEISLG